MPPMALLPLIVVFNIRPIAIRIPTVLVSIKTIHKIKMKGKLS